MSGGEDVEGIREAAREKTSTYPNDDKFTSGAPLLLLSAAPAVFHLILPFETQWGLGDVVAQKIGENRKHLDNRRVALTAVYGMGFMGPVGHYWYLGLDGWCAYIFRPGTPMFLAAKIAADQIILGPIYVLAFYLWGAIMIDNSGFDGFKKKISKDFLPTYAAEMCIWPPFQAFNFTRIPVEHHLLAVNLMTVLDVSFLSWARSQEDWVMTILIALRMRPAKVA